MELLRTLGFMGGFAALFFGRHRFAQEIYDRRHRAGGTRDDRELHGHALGAMAATCFFVLAIAFVTR